MRVSVTDIMKIKVAPPGERYLRFAEKHAASSCACAFAAIPGIGASVFSGGRSPAEGIVVTILGDDDAAAAAGADRLIYSLNPPRAASLR